jgi:type I restriction enzyme S subunit
VLLGNTFHQEFMRTVAGVGGSLLRARPSQVAQIQIPVPPLDEQRRIAAILDKADVLRAKRRAAIVKLDSLTQSIFLDMFGNPVTNPKSWPSKSLTEVCDTFSGGTPSKADDSFWNGNIPWFSAKDMKKGDLFDAEDHVTESAFDQTSLRLLAENTVAIVVRGMILAHTFPVCVLKNPSAINQDLKALIPRLPLPADYLAANLRCQSPHVLSAVSEAAHGTKRLDAEGLRKIAILLPPIEMRHEFATRSAKVSAMRRAYTSSLGRLDALFASLQHRAFNGELRTTAAQDGY